MGYPQQPQNDPNQYPQQPYQQQPGYPQSPTPGASNLGNIDFAAITTMENRPYLIAGIGGLVAFLGYFILPYYTFSIAGISIAGITEPGTSESFSGSQAGSWLFLSLLGGLVAVVVAVIVALGIRAIPQLTPQLSTRILIGSGVVSIVGLVLFLIQVPGKSGAGYSYGVGLGFWIAVLASIAIIVGGVMAFRKTA